MSQHGRRRAVSAPVVVDDEPVRRVGFLTMETALVLGLIVLIVAGSFLVHVTFPSNRESETVIGDQKVRITTVGKGGVLPGPVEPRVIPVVVPTPAPVRTPKPAKPKPVTAVPTPTPTPSPTPKPGGGGTSPLPGGGGGGGGNQECTVLIFCKPGETPAPTPKPQPANPDPANPANPAQPPAAG